MNVWDGVSAWCWWLLADEKIFVDERRREGGNRKTGGASEAGPKPKSSADIILSLIRNSWIVSMSISSTSARFSYLNLGMAGRFWLKAQSQGSEVEMFSLIKDEISHNEIIYKAQVFLHQQRCKELGSIDLIYIGQMNWSLRFYTYLNPLIDNTLSISHPKSTTINTNTSQIVFIKSQVRWCKFSINIFYMVNC